MAEAAGVLQIIESDEMDSITHSRQFSYGGTVRQLLQAACEWRQSLPGEPSPGYFPFYNPATGEQSVNIDMWTTKFLGSTNDRLHVGAVRVKGVGLLDRAATVLDRGRDAETMLRENDPLIGDVRRVEVLVTLAKYGDVQVPKYSLGVMEGSYSVKAWSLDHEAFAPVVLSVTPKANTATGWMQFPDILLDECEMLLGQLVSFNKVDADDRAAKQSELELTAREKEAAEFIASGYSNADGAKQMVISESSFETHSTNIGDKLKAANGLEGTLTRLKKIELLKNLGFGKKSTE